MKNKTTFILMFIFALLVFPMVSADIMIQEVDKTSGIILNDTIDVELRNAIVEINTEGKWKYLTALFEVYSNEDEIQRTIVYLKAKGQECYHDCHDVEVAEHSTSFNINNDNDFGSVNYPSEGVSDSAEIYETTDGKFAGVEFDLLPNQVNTIKVYQKITIPFEYYLDSLSTFSKADYEKITIKGDNLNVQFNEKYPVKKISENEWVWEYSNMNTNDENLKDVLAISKEDSPEPEPKKSFFQKIIDWFKNLF
jgi:hypothetical protein